MGDVIRNELPDELRKRNPLYQFEGQNLEEIESDIVEAQKKVNSAILSLGLAIHYIDKEALYVEAGCKSMNEYIEKADTRLNGMPRQTVSNYKLIGEAYMKYRADLEKIGFSEEDGVHKLRYIDRLLEEHKKPVAMKYLKDLSTNQIKDMLRRSVKKELLDQHKVEINEDGVWIDDKLKIKTQQVWDILSQGQEPYLIGVEGQGEIRVITRTLKAHRESK